LEEKEPTTMLAVAVGWFEVAVQPIRAVVILPS